MYIDVPLTAIFGLIEELMYKPYKVYSVLSIITCFICAADMFNLVRVL